LLQNEKSYLKSQNKDKTAIYRELAPYMNLGTQFLVTIALFIWIGYWLDGKYDSKNYIVYFSISGLIVAGISFANTIRRLEKKNKKKKIEP